MKTQRYRHRVTIEVYQETRDSNDLPNGHDWAPFVLNWPCEVLTGPGREFRAADAKQSEVAARINGRWFPGLLASMRIDWQGRLFEIIAITTDATDRREYRLTCKDGPTDGS